MNIVDTRMTVGVPAEFRFPSFILGDLVDLAELPPEKIRLMDVATTLSHVNRFNGRAGGYNVAHHAVFVSRLVRSKKAFPALHHDDTEAYTGDVIAPIKRKCQVVYELEAALWPRIAQAFNIPVADLDAEVHEADQRAYFFETHILQGRAVCLPGPEHYGDFRNLAEIRDFLRPKSPQASARAFIERHLELMPQSEGGVLVGEDE